jgi:hypothetical protein
MKIELENQLYNKYSDFFSNKDKSIQESCMAWGIECGDGWFDILSSLCFQIHQHEENINRQIKWKQEQDPEYNSDYYAFKFDQIKEKFGGLRIYFSGGDEYIEGLISMSEDFSYQICEVCGQRGKPNKGGWISTLCENCKNK